MEKKTYTKFDLERLQKEYNNANSKRSKEVILQMMEEVKAEIGEGVRWWRGNPRSTQILRNVNATGLAENVIRIFV